MSGRQWLGLALVGGAAWYWFHGRKVQATDTATSDTGVPFGPTVNPDLAPDANVEGPRLPTGELYTHDSVTGVNAY